MLGFVLVADNGKMNKIDSDSVLETLHWRLWHPQLVTVEYHRGYSIRIKGNSGIQKLEVVYYISREDLPH